MSKSNVAVLLPCRNEAGAIGNVIEEIHNIAPDFKIYVCDNVSGDGTADIATKAGAIVIYEPKIGKGNAMNTLFNSINADCYIMCDGDNTYDTSNIKEMSEIILNGYDFVTGDRLCNNYYKSSISISHKIGNVIINCIAKVLYGHGVHDLLSGYRAMSRSFINSLSVLHGGFTVETELSIHALTGNFKLTNLPVFVRNRIYGKSKINIHDGFEIISCLLTNKQQKQHTQQRFTCYDIVDD